MMIWFAFTLSTHKSYAALFFAPPIKGRIIFTAQPSLDNITFFDKISEIAMKNLTKKEILSISGGFSLPTKEQVSDYALHISTAASSLLVFEVLFPVNAFTPKITACTALIASIIAEKPNLVLFPLEKVF